MGEAAPVWKRLAGSSGVPPEGDGVWDVLRKDLNPALYHPRQSSVVHTIPLATRSGQPYYILTNRDRYTYLRLGPEEQFLWSLMDGTRSVKDLVVEYFSKFGALAFGLVGQLVAHLKRAYMLADSPIDVFDAVRRKLERRRWQYAPLLIWQILTGQRGLTLRRVDDFIAWIHRHGGWLLYTAPMQVLYFSVSLIGVWIFATQVMSGRFSLFQVNGSFAKGLLLLYILNYLSIAIHEFAHALTCKHYGARVNGAGVMLYFGMPAFYIDTTDIWTKPARMRIATSWAGPYSGLILAGVCSILVALTPTTPLSPIFHRLAFLSVVIVLFNLIPLLELDGYFILIDWLEIPMLRSKAIAFVRKELWRKLREREGLPPEERLLAWFGVLSLAFSVFAVFLAFRFWQWRLGGVIGELWRGGIGSRIALAFLLLALALPLIVGLGGRVVTAGRAATGWARTRWRQPRRRSVEERIALLRRVPLLSPLPEERFAEIARRMGRETYRPHEIVFRRGEIGDRFYVLESGTVEVLTDGSQLRAVLSTGDYFGEVALLYRIPRSATIRAQSPVSVLWLGKGDFDRLLSDHVAASVAIDQAINAQERLRTYPVFSQLPARALHSLAERLRHEQFAAGATVVQAGSRGDAFFLIDSGQAEVLVDAGRVRTIGRGDYFGEIALLLDVPRTATVRALTPLEVFRLSRQDFDDLVRTELTHAATTFESTGRQRLAAARQIPTGG